MGQHKHNPTAIAKLRSNFMGLQGVAADHWRTGRGDSAEASGYDDKAGERASDVPAD